MNRATLCLSIVFLAGCAAPTTRQVEVSAALTDTEAEKQREITVEEMVEQQKRISRIYWTLATKSRASCADQLGPGVGVHLAKRNDKTDLGKTMARMYSLKDRQTVLFVLDGSPAHAAGIKPGDVLTAMNDAAVLPETNLRDVVEKLPADAPITVKLERGSAPIDASIQPIPACKYPVILDSSQAINAYADGKIIAVTRGMVNFTKDDNELALVLSHELAHNVMKHIDAKKSNAVAGAVGDVLLAILSRGNYRGSSISQAASQSYSQEFEAEADYVGLYIMANAGLPIADAPKFWRRMAAANPANIRGSHSASHPSTAYRMVALEETVKQIREKDEKGEPLTPNMKDSKPVAPQAPVQ